MDVRRHLARAQEPEAVLLYEQRTERHLARRPAAARRPVLAVVPGTATRTSHLRGLRGLRQGS